MTRRNRVDAFVGRPVRAAAERQESRYVLFIKISNSCFFHERLQTVRPLNASVLYVIVKRTHAGEVACEDGGPALAIPKDQTPITDQVNETSSSPTFVRGARNRFISDLAL